MEVLITTLVLKRVDYHLMSKKERERERDSKDIITRIKKFQTEQTELIEQLCNLNTHRENNNPPNTANKIGFDRRPSADKAPKDPASKTKKNYQDQQEDNYSTSQEQIKNSTSTNKPCIQ